VLSKPSPFAHFFFFIIVVNIWWLHIKKKQALSEVFSKPYPWPFSQPSVPPPQSPPPCKMLALANHHTSQPTLPAHYYTHFFTSCIISCKQQQETYFTVLCGKTIKTDQRLQISFYFYSAAENH
jgi:hypothetical protein